MKNNTIPKSLTLLCALLFTAILHAQVGINTTSPSKSLDINIEDSPSDGINIGSNLFNIELLAEPGNGGVFALNNSRSTGAMALRFNANNRLIFTQNGFFPSVNAPNNTINGALDIGRFNLHFRRVYTQGVHTNDNNVNGGLRINIGSGGNATADYMFSDFAFYPVASQAKDLGRNSNFWRNFYFVSAFTPSDERLKKNIVPITRGLQTLQDFKMYEYNYIFEDQKRVHYGFMAQELQKLLPQLISIGEDDQKTLSINYIETIPIIIKAVQEQQELINTQNQKIDKLTLLVERLLEDKER